MTCVWDPDPSCLGDEWEGLSDAVKERSLMLASSSLQMLTNYRVGLCPITIRPVQDKPRCGCGFNPHLGVDGLWRNNCHHRHTYGPLSEYAIPGPVGFIDTLMINGEVVDMDDADWRLDNGYLLVWQGEGPSPIPAYQDLNKADTQPGTWSITYSKSYPVLADGRLAVALLAAEFAKACQPKKKCSLPRGVTSVVRNGVSFTIEAGLFPGGLTNIDIVDQYILKWVPAGAPNRSAVVFDPRKAQARITTGIPRRREPTSGASS